MTIFGWEITRRHRTATAADAQPVTTTVDAQKATGMDLVTHVPTYTLGIFGGLWQTIRESVTGAWQRGFTGPGGGDALTFGTVYACVTLIASDIGKLPLNLIALTEGVWQPTTNPAYSPLLRKPNHYQNRIKFVEYWITSKLISGNTYVLKERDNRKVVTALYILDPSRVQPLVADDGSVFYQLSTDNLAGVEEGTVVVPASEIIHDLMNALYHPLVGIPPTYACGLAAMQGLKIQQQSTAFFANGSNVGGVILVPGSISNDVADRLRKHWEENYSGEINAGKVAVLGDNMKFEQMQPMTAVNAQLIEQLKWTGENICACYHVPPHMVGVAPPPPYGNIQAINLQYYAQCLQNPIESLELALDEGIGLADDIGVQFDVKALLRMDTATAMETAAKGVIGGILSPNEARAEFDRKPVKGGDTPYLQQQNYSLEALAKRDEMAAAHPNVPELSPKPPTPPTPAPAPPPEPKVITVPAQGLDPLVVRSLADAIEKLATRVVAVGGVAEPIAASDATEVADVAAELATQLKAFAFEQAAA